MTVGGLTFDRMAGRIRLDLMCAVGAWVRTGEPQKVLVVAASQDHVERARKLVDAECTGLQLFASLPDGWVDVRYAVLGENDGA